MKYQIPEALETERLILRQFQEKDWNDLAAIQMDAECVKYTIKNPQAHWQVWRTLAGLVGHWQLRGYGPYAMEEKTTGKMLGPVGLWYPGDWPEPEIKWSLNRDFWGKGLVTEAAQAVKGMAFQKLSLKRLISLILPENTRSQNVAKRIGGVYEKTIPFRGENADIYAY